MKMTGNARRALLGTTGLCLVFLAGAPATAQEGQDGFLGTITLGESKREVQTETATAVTTIDQTEIDDRQAGTIAELIDSVPGVTLVNGATPQGSGINIRGFGSNNTFGTDQKVLIQVDGVTRGSEELYRIGNQLFTDPSLYKEVEVIRGTVGSFEYGSGVVGGVVRLETKDASDFTGGEVGLRFRQTLEFQTNGPGITSSSILAWQPTEKLELLLNYVQRDLDVQEDGRGDLINPAGGGIDDPSWLLKGKLTFGEGDAHSITSSFTHTQSTQFDVPYDSFGLANFGNVDRSTESETFMLRYGYNPADNDLIDVSLQFSYADEKIDQTALPPFPPGPFSTRDLRDADHRYETTTVTLKNRALFDTGNVSHDFVAGIELINRDREDATAAPGGDDQRWAVFAINEMTFGDALTITPAIRYESSKITRDVPVAGEALTYSDDAVMGGISAHYAFQNGFAIFGSAAYTEVLPPIDDLDNVGRVTQSEKSRTFEIGASFEKSGAFMDGDRLQLKANLYDTELWDITSSGNFFSPPEVPFPQFVLLDSIHTQGLEFEASYAMENGFYIDANANIVDGNETTGIFTKDDSRNQAANSLRLTVGKRFRDTYDLSWEVIANDEIEINGNRSSAFVVHNLRATIAPKKGVWKDTEFRIGVENLFDKQYEPRLSTRPSPGRNFKFTLAKTF